MLGRSRVDDQLGAKTDCPNGFEAPKYGDRCGRLPARSLDSRAAFAELDGGMLDDSGVDVEGVLKGLVDGVGREVLEMRCCCTLRPLTVPTGDILEGRVPARARLAGLVKPASAIGTRSGKPSCDGDSGTIDRGVEVPLTGGPQILGDRLDWPCNSRVLFVYSLEPCSCSGDPAPNLVPLELDMPLSAFGPLKGEVAVVAA